MSSRCTVVLGGLRVLCTLLSSCGVAKTNHHNSCWWKSISYGLCMAPARLCVHGHKRIRGYLPVFAALNPQSTCYGPQSGPTLAPQWSHGPPACPVTESTRKKPSGGRGPATIFHFFDLLPWNFSLTSMEVSTKVVFYHHGSTFTCRETSIEIGECRFTSMEFSMTYFHGS